MGLENVKGEFTFDLPGRPSLLPAFPSARAVAAPGLLIAAQQTYAAGRVSTQAFESAGRHALPVLRRENPVRREAW
jgi:hypothetical protein